MPKSPKHIARDPNTPEDVTLGEVYRAVRDISSAVSELDVKVDHLNEKGLPKRVENLEKWRDWALVGLAGLAMAGGAFFGIGL